MAGGKSSRMGRNKAWLPVGGLPLISRQIQLVGKLAPRRIWISAAPGHDYASLSCPVLVDAYPDQGPVSGIFTSLQKLETDLLLILAVDMPCMSARFLSRLLRRCSARRGVVPRLADRIEPLAAIYPKASWRVAEVLLEGGNFSVAHFARLCASAGLVAFQDCAEKESCLFTNWNRPEDVRPRFRRAG